MNIVILLSRKNYNFRLIDYELKKYEYLKVESFFKNNLFLIV